MEQSESPGRRLVDDDLAARFLPAPTRWLVTATPQIKQHYAEPTGRNLTASQVEWSAYAEKA
jgi:hypothetical protein